MPVVEKSALVHHTPMQMFELVADVAAYPEFLPWCSASRVLSEDETRVCAEIEVSRVGIKQKFSTCNNFIRGESMSLKLDKGPFKSLDGLWQFTGLGDEACKVQLQLEFEFSGKLINTAFGKVFSIIANDLVDAFCKRADEVYR
ncbi:MAG: type II toxin-antitoxin system RatA family toxin [Gammaproteobacteria bacterium]|nr:type II toxin-antitoxin system RatA family toxin [Gammaproteobacteria bacterium]